MLLNCSFKGVFKEFLNYMAFVRGKKLEKPVLPLPLVKFRSVSKLLPFSDFRGLLKFA